VFIQRYFASMNSIEDNLNHDAMTTAIISHTDCRRHKMAIGHPEDASRIDAISERLLASGLEYSLDYFDAQAVGLPHLLRVHDKEYLSSLDKLQPREGLVNIDPDTQMSPQTLTAASRAAGAGIQAVDLVFNDNYHAVFCNVRPPGHHAKRREAGGFCFYNNIAVAAAYALDKFKLERVAIIDFDVHHGNGTEDIFNDNQQVMFFSLFQHPFFPYSSATTANPLHIKSPLRQGAGSEEFRRVVREHWLPELLAYQPQMLFISAGFDAHREDDLGGLTFEDDDYAWVTNQLVTLSKQLNCHGIVSMLEGGYVSGALGRSCVAHIKELAEI